MCALCTCPRTHLHFDFTSTSKRGTRIRLCHSSLGPYFTPRTFSHPAPNTTQTPPLFSLFPSLELRRCTAPSFLSTRTCLFAIARPSSPSRSLHFSLPRSQLLSHAPAASRHCSRRVSSHVCALPSRHRLASRRRARGRAASHKPYSIDKADHCASRRARRRATRRARRRVKHGRDSTGATPAL